MKSRDRRWQNLKILVFFCAAISMNVFAQTNTFFKTYDEGYIRKILLTHTGEFIIAGGTYLPTPGNPEALYVAKIDQNGDTIWTKKYGLMNGNETVHSNFWGNDIIDSDNNNFLICGGAMQALTHGGTNDVLFTKINQQGDTLFWHVFDFNSPSDYANAIVDNGMGETILAGSTGDSGLVLKLNENGFIDFLKKISLGITEGGGTSFTNITKNVNNELYFGGKLTTITPALYVSSKFFVLKTNNNIDSLWLMKFGLDSVEVSPNSLILTKDNNLIFSGYVYDIYTPYIAYIAKLTQQGEIIWEKNFDFIIKKIVETEDSSLVLLSLDYNDHSSFSLLKTDRHGNKIWQQKIFLINAEQVDANSLVLANDNGIVIAGSVSYSGGNPRMFLLKTDPNGIFVVVDEPVNSPPEEFLITQNFPNPFNPSTTIQYSLPSEGKVIISIYNILGSSVATLINEEKSAGCYNVTWNGKDNFDNDVTSGVYFYIIKFSNKSISRKMVLMR